jgi:hypothetical protein
VSHPDCFQTFNRLDWIWVAFMRQPQNTGLKKERLVADCEKLLPQFERTNGRTRIDFIGAIPHPDNPRFISGTRAVVTRSVRVNEYRPRPGTLQAISNPRTQHPCANDRDVIMLC